MTQGGVCLVDLWHGSLSKFVRSADSGSLSGDLTGQFVRVHRCPPSEAEVRSWDQSLPAVAAALRPLEKLELGVAIGATGPTTGAADLRDREGGPPGVALEYHLPLKGSRIDVVITGHDASRQACAVVIELKQWSLVALEDEHATNVLVGEQEHVHPSEQARDYSDWLADYHSSFSTGLLAAVPAAYCHNLATPFDIPLRDDRFADLLRRSPLFTSGEERDLADFVATHVGRGDGVRLLGALTGAHFKPSKRVIWGRDLVWRTDRWVAQPHESKDGPVRSSSDMLRLVRNAYRVLMTRGLQGTTLLILDGETRAHIAECLASAV